MKANKIRVQLPIEYLPDLWPAHLKGKKIGCLLHPASVGPDFRHSLDVLEAFEGYLFKIAALFGPQHGIYGHTQDNMIEWKGYSDPRLKIPVYSLYGEHREPPPYMWEGIDALLVDLQDVGARYYTFIWTLLLCMQSAEKAGKEVIVLDRPNPLASLVEEGSPLEMEYASFVGLHPIAIRHGKTIGELARLFKKERFPRLSLTVLEMKGYSGEMWFDETNLPWVMPSPNMPTLDTAIVYPGMCLFEATNVSEGRGTTRPFEIFGAPFINAEDLCDHMNSLGMPGVFFRRNHFQPTFHKWSGQICNGAQIHVLDRTQFPSFRSAIELLKYLFHAYPDQFQWKPPPYEYEYDKLPIDILLGNGWYRKKMIEGSSR